MPDSITRIGYQAFSGCSSLNDITLSNNLQEIDGRAFAYCASLTHLELPQSLEKIGTACFTDCTNLKELTIPENVNEIEGSNQPQFENSGVTRVIFKNPYGWSRKLNAAGYGETEVSSDVLSDPEEAYKLMTQYCSYIFFRK